jgi:hypothetical protein
MAFIPILVIGTVLFGRIGVSSGSAGADAMRRIAEAGTAFPITNALFHLGSLLLLPGAIALLIVLRDGDRDGFALLGTGSFLVGLAVAAGVVFSLNHGLFRAAAGFPNASPDQQVILASLAEMNLRTQAGAELVQSLLMGFWVLLAALAMGSNGWPPVIVYLGLAGGIGFVLAGLASVLIEVPIVGIGLGIAGAFGLLLFAIWLVVVGSRLLTLQVAS